MAKRSKKKKAPVRQIPAIAPGAGIVALQNPPWFRRDWLWGLILLLAVIFTYSPAWWAGYIWDDDILLTKNPCIIGPLGLKEIWTTKAADICQLTITTFWGEHALWGLGPLPYHLVNVLLHGLSAIVLWRVLRNLQIPGAWLGAALWALHPVLVESVAWITELKNTQSTFFYLLSVLLFTKWLRANESDERRGWNYGLTLLFAALAMASKSSTVILPVVLGLCAWWIEGRWQWRNLMKVGPIVLMSIVAGCASIWTQKLLMAPVPDSQSARTWPERLATAGDAIWFYLGKLVWPHPLIVIYPRWQIDAGQWFSWLPLLAVIVTLFLFWFNRQSWSHLWFFVFAYFVVTLLPALGLIDNTFSRYSFVADHFQYLAAMGPLALAAAGMFWLADRVIPNKPWLRSILAGGVVLLLATLSWQRAWAYESEETLWTDALAKNPNCWVGYNNLGEALLQKGQVDEAIPEFQKALEIYPSLDVAINNLASAFLKIGKLDQAMVQYQKALENNANDPTAHNNLGIVLFQKGRVDEAITQYQKALELNPSYDLAHNGLGVAFLQKGQLDEATAQFEMAVRINPKVAAFHDNLGLALSRKGPADEAITQFQEALRLKPDDASVQDHLSEAQAMARQAHGSK